MVAGGGLALATPPARERKSARIWDSVAWVSAPSGIRVPAGPFCPEPFIPVRAGRPVLNQTSILGLVQNRVTVLPGSGTLLGCYHRPGTLEPCLDLDFPTNV